MTNDQRVVLTPQLVEVSVYYAIASAVDVDALLSPMTDCVDHADRASVPVSAATYIPAIPRIAWGHPAEGAPGAVLRNMATRGVPAVLLLAKIVKDVPRCLKGQCAEQSSMARASSFKESKGGSGFGETEKGVGAGPSLVARESSAKVPTEERNVGDTSGDAVVVLEKGARVENQGALLAVVLSAVENQVAEEGAPVVWRCSTCGRHGWN